jgi:hypothetical protein
MRNDNDDNKPDQRPPADALTNHEHQLIRHRLATEAARRKRASAKYMSAKYVKISLDGRDSARLPLDRPGQTVFEIQEGAALVELWSNDEHGELLLAAHFVPYMEDRGIGPATFTTRLNAGRSLTLTITPAIPGGDKRHAWGIVQYERSALSLIEPGWSATLKYVLAAIVLAVLGLLLLKTQRELADTRRLLQKNSSEVASIIARPEEAVPITPVKSYRLIPDEAITRGGEGAGIPSIPVGPRPALIILQLPIAGDRSMSYRAVLTPFMKSTEIVSENELAPISAPSGRVVEFIVPSMLVRAERDYSISLRAMNSKGTWNEVSSFTFHVSAIHEPKAPR